MLVSDTVVRHLSRGSEMRISGADQDAGIKVGHDA